MKWVLLTTILLVAESVFGTPTFGADYQLKGDEIWVMKNGTIVQKIDVQKAQESSMRIRGPRGGEIMFCGPGGCKPQQPAPQEQAPPKFDMPSDEPPQLDLPAPSGPPIDTIIPLVAALAGGVSGYFATKASEDAKDDEPEDDEPAEPVKK